MAVQLSHLSDLKKGHSVWLTAHAVHFQSGIVAKASPAMLAPSMKSALRTPPLHLSRSNRLALRAEILKMKFQHQTTFMNTSSLGVAMSRI